VQLAVANGGIKSSKPKFSAELITND